MKLVNYELQTRIEQLTPNKPNSFFKEYLTSILEDTTKPYYKRADYIGLSLDEIRSKIDSLSQDIKELQQLKKRLLASLDIAKELTAEVLIANGIDRIDGNIISSLTLIESSETMEEKIILKDENAVMGLGYVKFEPDMEAIKQALQDEEGLKELGAYISVETITTPKSAKVKINMKRSHLHTQADTLLEMSDDAA